MPILVEWRTTTIPYHTTTVPYHTTTMTYLPGSFFGLKFESIPSIIRDVQFQSFRQIDKGKNGKIVGIVRVHEKDIELARVDHVTFIGFQGRCRRGNGFANFVNESSHQRVTSIIATEPVVGIFNRQSQDLLFGTGNSRIMVIVFVGQDDTSNVP
jgi:hypothetical protein